MIAKGIPSSCRHHIIFLRHDDPDLIFDDAFLPNDARNRVDGDEVKSAEESKQIEWSSDSMGCDARCFDADADKSSASADGALANCG